MPHMTASRLAFAILALTTLGGTGQPVSPASRATAQATAHILQPVIVSGGKALQGGTHSQVLQTRERKCAAVDAPAGIECRLILTDLE